MHNIILEKANFLSLDMASITDALVKRLSSDTQLMSMYKKMMPKTYARYGTPTIAMQIDKNAVIEKKITKYFNSKITTKKIKVQTFAMRDRDINAFTIPGVQATDTELTIGQATNGSRVAKQYNIHGYLDSKNKPIIEASKNVMPLIFVTSGLANNAKITDDEKLAIIAHEIGHWSSGATTLQSIQAYPNFIAIIGGAAAGIAAKTATEGQLPILLMVGIVIYVRAMIDNSIGRGAEFKADEFAKNVGYGVPLATSLQKMSGWSELATTKERLAQVKTFNDMLSPIVDFLTFSSHPDVYRRSERVLESSSISFDFAFNLVSKLFSKVDNVIANDPVNPMLFLYGKK